MPAYWLCYRKTDMTFELLPTKDFYRHFGNGYCMEMPTNQDQLNRLQNFLREQKAQWRFYATLSDGNWFHGMHIVFIKNTNTDSIMRHICGLLEIGSYCIVEGSTQTVVDTNGDVLSFADFTEKYDD